MAVFEKARKNTDHQVVVDLLTMLDDHPQASQRDMAAELGVSLGMVVRYLKSCAKKGWVRSKQVSPNRWAYFLTPQGLAEKSLMVAACLSRSFSFFRQAQQQFNQLFQQCHLNQYKNVVMVGPGDMADIALLVASSYDIQLRSVAIDNEHELISADAVVITDIQNPQKTYDTLKQFINTDKLLSIHLLCISRHSHTLLDG